MALSTITNLKQQLGIGARPNLFEISFAWPATLDTNIITAANRAKYLCKSAAIPAFTVGVIEVPYRGGRRIKVPGDRTFADWTATFLSDDAHTLRGVFNLWLNYVKSSNYNSEFIRSEGASGFDYMIDIKVDHLKQDNSVSRSYQLFECFPTDVGAIDLSYDSSDTISEFTVTFQYHSMTAATGIVIDDPTDVNSATPVPTA